jgi:dTDP-4-amino-4,6-dideoxygalactose transaminase
LKKACRFQTQRQTMAEHYNAAFKALPLRLPPPAPTGDMHAWHLYVIRLTDQAPLTRDAFIQQMAERGIGCSVHFIPLHLHPYWRDTYNLRPEQFPAAQAAYERAVSLPLYTRMTAADQARVIAAVFALMQPAGQCATAGGVG